MTSALNPEIGDHFVKQHRRYAVIAVRGDTVTLVNATIAVPHAFNETVAKLTTAGYHLEKMCV